MKLTRILMALVAAAALVAVDGAAIAQPKDKDQKEHGSSGKEKKAKQHKHQNGKALLGDRIKTNGKHKLEQRGKHTAYANTRDGKITGVVVEKSDGGTVPVKKYKTTKKMVAAGGMQAVSLQLAQAQYMGTTWIGYAYIDEWGDEVIYWYEYDMIYDGDTGATEYIPVY
jgi:hypothetical protein